MISTKVLLLCLCAPAIASANTYVFRDLGPLGLATSVRDLNDHGQVVGSSLGTDGRTQQAWLWQGNSRTTLGLLSGPSADALAVNNAGQIAGWTTLNTHAGGADFDQRATLWINGNPIDLGTLAGGTGSSARDINNLGHIVGYSNVSGNGANHAALWMGGTPIDLKPTGDGSEAFGINDADVVVGFMYVQVPDAGVYGIRHATRWNGTVATDLGTLGGLMSEAHAINDVGVVVGYAHTPDLKDHATKWIGNTAIDLHAASNSGLAGFEESLAYNINNAGQIVGERDSAANDRRATLWNGSTAIDLNNEIDQSATGAGWILRSALAISDDGCIVGVADKGQPYVDEHAYMLVPVGAPPPSAVLPASADSVLNVQPLATVDARPTPTTTAGGGGATGLLELTALATLLLLIYAPRFGRRTTRTNISHDVVVGTSKNTYDPLRHTESL